tara:strand:+ start:265 stop:447 length:183 start_codon:yes stop_codon:yes gene_type:complete
MTESNKLDELAQGIADITLELMHDTVEWQIEDVDYTGDDYHAIHEQVMILAIKKMYKEIS